MTYNTSEIMKAAWKNTRLMMKVMGYWPRQLRQVFAVQLKAAWRAAQKAAGEVILTAKEISFQIMRLECKDTLQTSDFKKLDDLRAQQRAAWKQDVPTTMVAA
ncbi:MAG: hypothetical protein GQ535_15505 [Rhodobacteraceae bacterium]|nr:hypothetical protein [Paracoccaceae bacterium]